jgi:hypothetical protein
MPIDRFLVENEIVSYRIENLNAAVATSLLSTATVSLP